MSVLCEIFMELFYFCLYLAPMVIVLLVLLALACYGFQMVRLFFRF